MNPPRYLLGVCLLCVACVDARAKEPQGAAEFSAGAQLSSADFAQTGPVPPARGGIAGAGIAPSGPPATGPVGAAGVNAV
ncbi:MAG TPA: hypothetical protein VJV78_44680, partial [Polyangiales bacterium]|nr:hypothetical protein [Polyangiales bacterium]